ncbi:sulfofructose kinase-like [Phoenix dactylifera]|uniref:Sulfofructose kinase-like n=1 Tax=Phoenix dactylifera TaxID=42345 RepID=A0A8B7CCR0_PHODC|nr:sulfofructose kinase-like [Phoenix dactylifera]
MTMKLSPAISNGPHAPSLPLLSPSLRRPKLPSLRPRIPRAEMSSSSSSSSSQNEQAVVASPSVPPLPTNRIVLGCGLASVDYLATVAAFPEPDEKIRSTSLRVEGGGNTGNALTSAARLGVKPRIISKVANDAQGRNALAELEADGVDTSYMVVSENGNSPFTYIIVDNQTKTRTCIHTPGYPEMVPEDLSESSLCSALDGANLVFFDGRLHETALVVAEEASRRKIPILIDAERKREGLDDLLNLATYVVCSEKFPQAWTTAPSIPTALVSILLRLPQVRFVIVMLGDKGCIMLERSINEASETKETDVESLLESVRQKFDRSTTIPTCISSESSLRVSADGIGAISGRLLMCIAEVVPPSELIDTTGAGDAFIGAVLYGLCAGMPPEKLLPFASQVAAIGCRALGARSGLPWRTDPRLAPFWH